MLRNPIRLLCLVWIIELCRMSSNILFSILFLYSSKLDWEWIGWNVTNRLDQFKELRLIQLVPLYYVFFLHLFDFYFKIEINNDLKWIFFATLPTDWVDSKCRLIQLVWVALGTILNTILIILRIFWSYLILSWWRTLIDR